ncbi:MAG: metal ABC transporter permease, partial [Candidatus Thiodiazotropha endolucinida]
VLVNRLNERRFYRAPTIYVWTRDITHLLIIGVLGAFLSGFVGLLLSYHASLPSGPAIILTAGAFYLLSLAFGPDGVIMTRIRPRRHLEA